MACAPAGWAASAQGRGWETAWGDVQLEGVAGRRNHGRVEVCVGGSWGTFCLTNATNRDASVICRQVGYGAAGELSIINVLLIFI